MCTYNHQCYWITFTTFSFLTDLAKWLTQYMSLSCGIVIVIILHCHHHPALFSVYSAPDHMVNTSQFLCGILYWHTSHWCMWSIFCIWNLMAIIVAGTYFAVVWLIKKFDFWSMCGVYMWTTVEGQSDIYVQCGRHICSGEYVSNVKCTYTSALVTLLITVSSYDVYILT